MINIERFYSLLATILIAFASTTMVACGGMYGQQQGFNPNFAQNNLNTRGGPVGRVALAMNNGGFSGAVMVPGAGENVYAGSGFDPSTHGQILAQYNAQRPLLVSGAGDLGNGTTGSGSSNGSAVRRAASSERLDRVARAIGTVAAHQEAQDRTIAVQGRTLGRIAQRLDQTRPSPAPAPVVPAPANPPAPATGSTVWTDVVD